MSFPVYKIIPFLNLFSHSSFNSINPERYFLSISLEDLTLIPIISPSVFSSTKSASFLD